MSKQKQIYTAPQSDLLAFCGDPIMLSPGGDDDEGMWQMLISGTDEQKA